MPTSQYPGGVDEGPAVAGLGDMCKIADKCGYLYIHKG